MLKLPGTKSWTLVGLVSNGVRCAGKLSIISIILCLDE